jgi:ribokinase
MTSASAADQRGGVVVVGAINVDLIVAVQRLPGPGETVVGGRLERHGGGKGANAAVAAARAGAAVRLIGAVGSDENGSSALRELQAEGVDTADVAVLDSDATGVALIVVDPAGENQIAVAAGANSGVSADQVRGALRDALPTAGCVLVSTEISGEAVAAAVVTATAAGVACILNPAPAVPAVLDVLEHGPILTPNATELADLASMLNGEPGGVTGGQPEPAGHEAAHLRARESMRRTGAPVIVTLGGDGAMVLTPDDGMERLPSPPATVRDTTGAGDTFNGVLAARIAAGDRLPAAARTATVAASLSVSHVGARAGMPDATAIAAPVQTA